jgi:hypothetical protein
VIYFIITLKSKSVSADFSYVSTCAMQLLIHLIENTSESKIILARHELPYRFVQNERIIDLNCSDLPIPEGKDQMMVDKVMKLNRAYAFVKDQGYGTTMQIDYDDLISSEFLRFFDSHNMEQGEAYYIQKGYIFPAGSRWIYLDNNLYLRCGSTWIIRWRVEDFSAAEDGTANVIRWGHHELYNKLNALQFKLTACTKPSCLYRTDHAENHSGIKWQGWHGKKRFLKDLVRMRFLSKSKRHEFGIN